MGFRPGRCYHWDSPAYTRVSNNPQDSFITGIPGTRLTKHEMGNLQGKADTEISIVSRHKITIRSNSLEAARKTINKGLEEMIGISNYKFRIRVFPHHVIRENIMATGAGADRVQSGMRQSFGKPTGTAARVTKNQEIVSVYLKKENERVINAKKALKKGVKKLPGELAIVVKEIKPQKQEQDKKKEKMTDDTGEKRLNVVVRIEVLPKDVDVDLEAVLAKVKEIVEGHGKLHSSEIKPIAFGLKSIHAALLLNDKKSGMDEIEEKINAIEDVSEVKVVDMTLL